MHARSAAWKVELLSSTEFGIVNPPVALGSGKPSSPWARMHCVNSSIFEVTPSEGEEPPVDPAAAAVVVGLDPELATPGVADPPPHADEPSPTPTNAVSKVLHRHRLAECSGVLPVCPALTSVTSCCAVSPRANA